MKLTRISEQYLKAFASRFIKSTCRPRAANVARRPSMMIVSRHSSGRAISRILKQGGHLMSMGGGVSKLGLNQLTNWTPERAGRLEGANENCAQPWLALSQSRQKYAFTLKSEPCTSYQYFLTFLKCTLGGGVLQKSDRRGVKKFPGVREPPPGRCRNIHVGNFKQSQRRFGASEFRSAEYDNSAF